MKLSIKGLLISCVRGIGLASYMTPAMNMKERADQSSSPKTQRGETTSKAKGGIHWPGDFTTLADDIRWAEANVSISWMRDYWIGELMEKQSCSRSEALVLLASLCPEDGRRMGGSDGILAEGQASPLNRIYPEQGRW